MAANYWLVLGVLLLIGEVFTMDFSLTCFGLACFVAALLSWLGLSMYWQLGIGAVVIFALLFTLRPIFLKYLHKGQLHVKTNMDALAGKKARVFEVSAEDDKKGTVKIDGDLWNIHCNTALKKGDDVVVEKVEGITLLVKREEH